MNRGVTLERIKRDAKRDALTDKEVDFIIYNNEGIEALKCVCDHILYTLEKGFLKKVVYISCPITGHDLYTQKEKIDAKIRELNNEYCIYINPFNVEIVEKGKTYGQYIGADIRTLIDEVDEVYFMKGWEESRGCRLEKATCDIYNIRYSYES